MAVTTAWWLAVGAAAMILGPDGPGDGGGMATGDKAAPVPGVEERLAEFLRQSGTDPSGCRFQRVGLRFPGWTFVSVACATAEPALDAGVPDRPMVVRDDGTVVAGPPDPEIARFLASVGLPDADPGEPLDRVARAVLFLAGDPARVLKDEEAMDWLRVRKGAPLEGPSLVRKRGAATLAFWAQAPAGGREGPSFVRYEVRLDAKGRARLARKAHKTTAR